jgi:hypothetical protein
VTNLSLLARLLGAAGAYRPFLAVGPGAYRAAGSWRAGAQVGLGLEVPVTSRVALTTGATAHFVSAAKRTGSLSWLDAYLGFVLDVP